MLSLNQNSNQEIEAYLKVNSNVGASMMNTIYKAIEEFTGYKIERNTL